MGSLGEVGDGKEIFHGHGHSDPVVDELNRLQNLLRGLLCLCFA
jgi:predicted esterase